MERPRGSSASERPAQGLRYSPSDVHDDLLYLRKYSGYSPERLAGCEALVACLGGPTETVKVLLDRLESAMDSLGNDDSYLLRAVFGLADATHGVPTLGERRDIIGDRLKLEREAVADRDAAAVERLRMRLLTGRYPKSPMGIRVPESHNGFVQHAVHLSTVVRNRRHLETTHSYQLVALYDDIEYLAVTSADWGTPEVASANFRLETVEASQGRAHQFWHAAPMRRGRTYDLHFRVRNPDPDEPAWLTEESLAFHEPTRFASFDVTFVGDIPDLIWRVDGKTMHERPGQPTADLLLPNGQVPDFNAQYRDVYGGLFYGIAWEWRER